MTDKRQNIDLELIRNLANILNETNLTEIKIDKNGMRIHLLRSVSKTSLTAYSSETAASASPIVVSAIDAAMPSIASGYNDPKASNPALTVPAIKSTINDNLHIVTSPMVGTAYLSPYPGEKPFVEVGSMVNEGQTLLIIEAMKTMNHIVALRYGKIIEIKVKDAQLVEYGETLLILE